MEHSESIKNIATALQLFQSKMKGVNKDAKNPFFKSNYASLSNIQETIQPVLTECGLVYSQMPEGLHQLTTMLVHSKTGEYFKSTYTMTPEKKTPQGVGSCITYQKRYALSAVLGLNTDYDDDGNEASTPTKAAPQQRPIFTKADAEKYRKTICVYLEQGLTPSQISDKLLVKYANVSADAMKEIEALAKKVPANA